MTDHKTLTEALTAFQANLPDVSKGSTNPAFKSKYADLADVVKVVLPELAAHGLAWVTAPTRTDAGFTLRWELRHVSGENLTGEWPLPDGATPQQLGSWITYGRRYCLSAVVGIAPDEDDDGNAASAKGAPRAKPSEKVDAAVRAIEACVDPVKLDEIEDYAKTVGVAGVAAVKAAIAAKRAVLGASGVDAWQPEPA